MASSKQLHAELKVVELEEKLVKAKEKKNGPSKELKAELRAARQAFREAREAQAAPDGQARPGTIATTASAKSAGGN